MIGTSEMRHWNPHLHMVLVVPYKSVPEPTWHRSSVPILSQDFVQTSPVLGHTGPEPPWALLCATLPQHQDHHAVSRILVWSNIPFLSLELNEQAQLQKRSLIHDPTSPDFTLGACSKTDTITMATAKLRLLSVDRQMEKWLSSFRWRCLLCTRVQRRQSLHFCFAGIIYRWLDAACHHGNPFDKVLCLFKSWSEVSLSLQEWLQ